MLSLQSHHIVDLYVWIDDLIPQKGSSVGRPSFLSESEVITILVWNTLMLRQKTVKDLFHFSCCYLTQEFPRFPKYNAFLNQCHEAAPTMFGILQLILERKSPLIFMDSTMIPVCKLKRADSHKVTKEIAAFGKNHQGWHYGFKLHASISESKTLTAVDSHQRTFTMPK